METKPTLILTGKEAEAYDRGYECWCEGGDILSNPYILGSELHILFIRGYNES